MAVPSPQVCPRGTHPRGTEKQPAMGGTEGPAWGLGSLLTSPTDLWTRSVSAQEEA